MGEKSSETRWWIKKEINDNWIRPVEDLAGKGRLSQMKRTKQNYEGLQSFVKKRWRGAITISYAPNCLRWKLIHVGCEVTGSLSQIVCQEKAEVDSSQPLPSLAATAWGGRKKGRQAQEISRRREGHSRWVPTTTFWKMTAARNIQSWLFFVYVDIVRFILFQIFEQRKKFFFRMRNGVKSRICT